MNHKVRRYSQIQQFLDVEADVDNEEDEEDSDSESVDRGFIEDSVDDIVDESRQVPTSFSTRNDFDHDREDAIAHAEGIVSRYRHIQRVDHAPIEDNHTQSLHPVDIQSYSESMISGSEDLDLWRVLVKRSYENTAVETTRRKAFDLGIPIVNAFFRDGIPGCIYVQGEYPDVLTVVQGIHGVRLRRRQGHALIELVTYGDKMILLNKSFGSSLPKASTFVHFHTRGVIRNSLAYVHEVSLTKKEAVVYFVPRHINKQKRNDSSNLSQQHRRSTSSKYALAVADVDGNVSEPLTDDAHIHGLEIREIPFRSLRLHSIHPTESEIALFESSPLATVNTVFAHALNRLRPTVFDMNERVVVVAGPYKGLSGVVKEVNDLYVMLTVYQTPDFGFFEVPLKDLPSASIVLEVNSFMTISTGPYAGFCGYIRAITADHATIESTTNINLEVDVQVWNLRRDVRVGEYVTIIQGDYYGSNGFVVAVDMPTVEVYLCDSTHQDEEPQITLLSALQVKHCTNSSKYAPQDRGDVLDHMGRKENYSGMEVSVKNHPVLKGLDGYIVGHRYETRVVESRSIETLVCEVNPGINISTFTTSVDAEHLYEKYSKLPIKKAIHLPRRFRHPIHQAPPRFHTPPPLEEDVWQEVMDPVVTQSRPMPWLTRREMRSRKCEIVIKGTVDMSGTSHIVPYHGGRYEGRRGYTVITEPGPFTDDSVVKVAVGPWSILPFRFYHLHPVSDPDVIVVGTRNVIIGPDVTGNEAHRGEYASVYACAYPLPDDQRLVLTESGKWGYFRLSSLCFSGPMAQWEGGMY